MNTRSRTGLLLCALLACEASPATPEAPIRNEVAKDAPEPVSTGKGLGELEAAPSPRPVATPAAPTKPEGQLEGHPITWVSIEGGSFEMRSDVDETLRPMQVEDFELAREEITFAQYEDCVGAGACTAVEWEGCDHGGQRESLEDPTRPVVCVTWTQARAFCEWVGGDLPSEAQWEFAARSRGKQRAFPWGDQKASCKRAVMNWGCDRPSKNQTTQPPCSRPRGHSEQGICDLAGNVAEWTGKVAPWDHETLKLGTRIVRGGGWAGIDPPYYRNSPRGPSLLRADHRSRNGVEGRSVSYGFRPARRPGGKQ